MGRSVSYKKSAWNDMGEAISHVSAWSSGILDRMSAMDQTFRDIRDAVDDLDEDHRVSFSYKSMDGSLDRLRHDYQKLYTFTGDAGEAVSRHIDHPFYTKMDAYVEAMAQISIDKITTKNTINVKQYRPRTSIASVGGAKLLKKEITLDDIFSNNALMDASIKSEYERFKAMTASKQAEKVTFDQYKEAIQYSHSFDYKSIRDKQIDKEFWVNLAVAGGIIILGIVCPPAGIAAGVAYGTMQVTEAATGTSLISGRKLSTEERVTEGVFGVLDAVPGLKAAGAFGAIGRAGSKSFSTVGELSYGMKQSGQVRLLDLKTPAVRKAVGIKEGIGEVVEKVKTIKHSKVQTVSKSTIESQWNNINKVYSGDLMSVHEAQRYDDYWRKSGIGSEKTWNEFVEHNPNSTIDDYFQLLHEQSPWPSGYDAHEHIVKLREGDTFHMVLDMRQKPSQPGGFGIMQDIPNIEYARNDLAIKSNWKLDCGKTVEYRIKPGVELKVPSGPIGPQIDLKANRYLNGNQFLTQLDLFNGLGSINRNKFIEYVPGSMKKLK